MRNRRTAATLHTTQGSKESQEIVRNREESEESERERKRSGAVVLGLALSIENCALRFAAAQVWGCAVGRFGGRFRSRPY